MTAHWIHKTVDGIKFSNYFIVHDITELYIHLKTVEGFIIMKKFYINN